MNETKMSLDNPNYFDVESPKTPESPGKSFFIFKKRNSSNKLIVTPKTKPTIAPTIPNTATPNVIELPPLNKRRGSLKGLLRSRSNSASTSFIQSPPIRQNSIDETDCSTPVYGNTGKFRERIGSYSEATAYGGNDDVFYSPTNESRYNYNNSTQYSNSSNGSITSGIRRHSIGTFVNKEQRMRTASITDEVPKMPAPKPPKTIPMHTRIRDVRKFGETNSSLTTTMDDILIITARQSESGVLWVNYLKTCFDKITKQRGRQPFNFLHLKIDDDQQMTSHLIQRCLSTKLQIVILCPVFITLSPPFLMAKLSTVLRPERVLGMILELSEAKVWEIHKEALPCYKQWRRCVVRNQDQTFVSDLLGIATDILGRALRQQPLATDTAHNTATANKLSYLENFTLMPRKVKMGQNKIVVMLNEPLMKDDWIKVKVEKIGQIIEITNIKRRNPYTLQCSIPESCMEVSMMIGVRVEKNNIDLGTRPIKCESRLRELEQILKGQDIPIEFMCQSLGITSTDRDKLDLYLVQSFQKNIPPNFHLLNSTSSTSSTSNTASASSPFITYKGKPFGYRYKETSPEEYPTLLHFAAKYGLERLCLQLLECPGGDQACEIKGHAGKTPSEMAEAAGHHKLAGSFKNFSQMNEFTTMYHYFKDISDASTSTTPSKTIIEAKSNATTSQSSTAPATPATTLKVNDSSDTKELNKEELTSLAANNNNIEGYLEMNGSGGEIPTTTQASTTLDNAVSNLNYLKIQNKNDIDIQNNMDDLKIAGDDEYDIKTNELKIIEKDYYESNDINTKTDKFSQECLNLLENLNSSTSSDNDCSISSISSASAYYLIQPSNIPVSQFENKIINRNVPQDFGDYLTHPSNIPVHQMDKAEKETRAATKSITNKPRDTSHLYLNIKKKDEHQMVYGHNFKNSTLKRQGSDTSKKSVDDELLEIINDFKNNVFTIQEVEQLVASWKNRNDVQKSFRDKQEQLQKMREEYERIQHNMTENLKRPTPFERMKRLFSRNKTQTNNKDTEVMNVATTPDTADVCDEIKFSLLNQSPHRPMSTLSLHSVSSSSSGRMSTGSACSGTSLGDSGTHSDHEERRNAYNSVCRVGNPGSLMDNYLIPPHPRPISTPSSTPTPVDEKERLYFPNSNSTNHSRSVTPAAASEHYIIFPSNMPVFPTPSPPFSSLSPPNDHNGNNNEYINFKPLNTIDENKESENTISIQPIVIQKSEVIYSQLDKKSNLCSSFKSNGNQQKNIVYEQCLNNNKINDVNSDAIKGDMTNATTEDDDILSTKNFNELCRNINELGNTAIMQGNSKESHSMRATPTNSDCPQHDYINLADTN